MNLHDKKQNLIEEFSQFIDTLAEDEWVEPANPLAEIDLFTLCKEFIALKTEVKQESRQFHQALESFREVFNTLQQSHEILSNELVEKRKTQQAESEQQQQALLSPLLLELIDLRDCLEISMAYKNNHRPSRFKTLFNKGESALIESLHEGQAMILRRLDRLLSKHEVQVLHTLNRLFDPQLMQAVATESHPEMENGRVISEIRKGFTWKNKMLRPAEVTINKHECTEYA
jgi:molecular chaperone GrpE